MALTLRSKISVYSADRTILARYTKMESLLEDYELRGYLRCARHIDLRAAMNNKDVDPKQGDFLNNPDHPDHPHQWGVRIGERFGWRVLCHAARKPEWNLILDTHEWQWSDISGKFSKPPEGGFVVGVWQGYYKAETKFRAKLAEEEEEEASSTAVDTKGKGKGKGVVFDAPKHAAGKKPQQPNKASEDHESLDALHGRLTGPLADDISATHAYADGVHIGERIGARHALLEAERWIWQEYGSAAAPPDADAVPGSFWDGVRDGFREARRSLEVAQAGEAGDASSSGGAVSTARSCGSTVRTSGKLLGTCEYPVGRGDEDDEEGGG